MTFASGIPARAHVHLLLALTLMLVGCAGEPSRPAPVVTPTAVPAPAASQEPVTVRIVPLPEMDAQGAPEQLAALAPPEALAPPRNSAAETLLAAARKAAGAGDFDRAIATLERGIKLAPRDHELWQQLAFSHFRLGNFEQALAIAERARTLAPRGSAGADETASLIKAIRHAQAGGG